VDGPGEDFLARARLAKEQHRGVALRDLRQHAHDFGQMRVARAEVVEGLQPGQSADETSAG
jgi:hypothetical protein